MISLMLKCLIESEQKLKLRRIFKNLRKELEQKSHVDVDIAVLSAHIRKSSNKTFIFVYKS